MTIMALEGGSHRHLGSFVRANLEPLYGATVRGAPTLFSLTCAQLAAPRQWGGDGSVLPLAIWANLGGHRRARRGMITEARIEEVLKPAGLDWITTLRAPAIRSLAEAGSLQLSLFDERDLATITSPDYPGERLVACRNPLLADERARKREDLLVATEKKLAAIAARVHRAKKPLRGKDKIALAIGRVIDKYKMAKHFDLNITDDRFTFARNTAKIDAEAALDGVYVVRTTVAEAVLDQTATVTAYKQLSTAERAFRSLKTVDLEVRPIYHRRADRVRAHVFLCMLAYYVEWHMRQKLKPILFDDHDKAAA